MTWTGRVKEIKRANFTRLAHIYWAGHLANCMDVEIARIAMFAAITDNKQDVNAENEEKNASNTPL